MLKGKGRHHRRITGNGFKRRTDMPRRQKDFRRKAV
jgi:hypothetical protein